MIATINFDPTTAAALEALAIGTEPLDSVRFLDRFVVQVRRNEIGRPGVTQKIAVSPELLVTDIEARTQAAISLTDATYPRFTCRTGARETWTDDEDEREGIDLARDGIPEDKVVDHLEAALRVWGYLPPLEV
jgi:hypothetical protein